MSEADAEASTSRLDAALPPASAPEAWPGTPRMATEVAVAAWEVAPATDAGAEGAGASGSEGAKLQ